MFSGIFFIISLHCLKCKAGNGSELCITDATLSGFIECCMYRLIPTCKWYLNCEKQQDYTSAALFVAFKAWLGYKQSAFSLKLYDLVKQEGLFFLS